MFSCYALLRFIPNGGIIPIGTGVLALYLTSRFGLKNLQSVSCLSAVLSFYALLVLLWHY